MLYTYLYGGHVEGRAEGYNENHAEPDWEQLGEDRPINQVPLEQVERGR